MTDAPDRIRAGVKATEEGLEPYILCKFARRAIWDAEYIRADIPHLPEELVERGGHMTDAPARIWATPNYLWEEERAWKDAVEYTRSDIPHLPEELVERVRKVYGDIIAASSIDGEYSSDWVEGAVGLLVVDILATIDGEEK